MKRIAVTGSGSREDTLVAKALSIMCGYDLCISPPFSQTAIKYGMSMDIEMCQWPDSYVYCLDVFTERIIVEQQYGGNFVSDGSVFKELVWLKCRYPHLELIYEQSMIHSLERVVVAYSAKNYDIIFHLSGRQKSSITGDCLPQLLDMYGIPYKPIHSPDSETDLKAMVEYLGISPVMSASFSLSKATRELTFK
ncbi:MAG: hypothetical protein LBS79_01405 [Tannerella sp.]|jgi:hypothetical protein|nr:hypothetical protein [Tannerella sp.]